MGRGRRHRRPAAASPRASIGPGHVVDYDGLQAMRWTQGTSTAWLVHEPNQAQAGGDGWRIMSEHDGVVSGMLVPLHRGVDVASRLPGPDTPPVAEYPLALALDQRLLWSITPTQVTVSGLRVLAVNAPTMTMPRALAEMMRSELLDVEHATRWAARRARQDVARLDLPAPTDETPLAAQLLGRRRR